MRKTRTCGVLIHTLLSFHILRVCVAVEIEIKCPEFCECDIFDHLRRATCQNRRLVSMELNVPPQAEILDLSDNQINDLGDKIFLELGLTNLKFLNLSHNKVRHIHFNAFVGLENLKTLDLSFNAIEYFTSSWFESLQSLEEFYLRGNKLRTINEEPQIDIKTLRVLDISKCGLTSLNVNVLQKVPNLEMLDISYNYLQMIKPEVLKTLPKLTDLKADFNNFNCIDKNLIKVRDFVKSKKIVFTDSCSGDVETSFTINHKTHKFQKMQMIDEAEDTTAISSTRNSWIVDVEENNRTVNKCNGTNNDRNSEDNSLLMEIIHLSPWLILTISFTYGVLCGMVLLCAINLCTEKNKTSNVADVEMPDGSISCNIRTTQSVPNLIARRDRRNLNRSSSVLYSTLQKAKRRVSREILDDDCDETLVLHEFNLANSTPVATRRPLVHNS